MSYSILGINCWRLYSHIICHTTHLFNSDAIDIECGLTNGYNRNRVMSLLVARAPVEVGPFFGGLEATRGSFIPTFLNGTKGFLLVRPGLCFLCKRAVDETGRILSDDNDFIWTKWIKVICKTLHPVKNKSNIKGYNFLILCHLSRTPRFGLCIYQSWHNDASSHE